VESVGVGSEESYPKANQRARRTIKRNKCFIALMPHIPKFGFSVGYVEVRIRPKFG